MPQALGVLGPVLAGLSSTFGAIGGAVSAFAATGFGGTLLSIGAAVGLSYLSTLLRPSAPQPKPQDQQATIKSSIAPRSRLYGRGKAGGVLLHASATGGYLHRVFALVSDEIDGIEEYWIDDVEVEINGSGDVTTGKFVYESASKVHIETRVGTDSQTAYSGITDWTSDHKANGIATAYVRLEQVPSEGFLDTFPNGANTGYRQVIRGHKVPDIASGASGITNAANYSWSDNAARVICDYLIHPDGLGLDASWITNALTEWQSAVSVCGEDITLKAGGTEDRYRIWSAYRFDERPADVLQRFLAACDGILVPTPSQGLALIPGKWTTPTVTIDDDALLAFDDVGRGRDALSTANIISGQYTSADHDYQATEADPWIDSDDVSERGEYKQEIELYPVPSHAQARRLMKLAAYRSNPDWVGTLTCNLRALPVIGERFVKVEISELGIDDTFEVLGVSYLIDPSTSILHGVQIQIAALSSDAYAWNAATEEGTAPAIPTFTSPDVSLPTPTGLDVTVVQKTIAGRDGAAAQLSWDAQASYLQVEARHKPTADSDWIAIPVADRATLAETGLLSDGTEYEFQIRTRSLSTGRVSAWTDSVTETVVADDAATAAVTNASVNGSGSVATISWRAPNSPNFLRANVYRSTSGSFGTAIEISTPGVYGSANQEQSWINGGLSVGVTYTYYVTAENVSGVETSPVTAGSYTPSP